jgi:hypothetical protein
MAGRSLLSLIFLAEVVFIGASSSARAQTTADANSFIGRYQARVTATQNEQPHWITPLVTITPRLEQELRTDFVHQVDQKGYAQWNYDNGKGLELIPARRIELLANLPPFLAHDHPGVQDGFGDVSFLMKFRMFARNEEAGNAIVTAFLGGSVPTGKNGNGSCCAIVTPTLAIGKGFGRFDYTTTASGTLPVSNALKLGHTVTWNSVLQYKAVRFWWPEIESNTNFFKGGPNDGTTQSFVTPGLILGRFPLHHRLGLTLGAGEQIAVTHFHLYNHAFVLTARLPF